MARTAQVYSAAELAKLPNAEFERILRNPSKAQTEFLQSWAAWQREDQAEPEGSWRTWLVLAGRGYGKTRMGAEWVREKASLHPGCRIALVAATLAEARSIMVEGESGILSLLDNIPPQWSPSTGRIEWPNGSLGFVYSAAETESLRGPQHDFAWADEIAKWAGGEPARRIFSPAWKSAGAQPRLCRPCGLFAV